MTHKEKEIIEKYRGLSAEDREAVRKLTAKLRILLYKNCDDT